MCINVPYMKSISSYIVIYKLQRNLINCFCASENDLTDRYDCKQFKEFYEYSGRKRYLMADYHTQANGKIDRLPRLLQKSLRRKREFI